MPWYTLVDAPNKPQIPPGWAHSIIRGKKDVGRSLSDVIASGQTKRGRPVVVALDGFLGAQFTEVLSEVGALLGEQGLSTETVDVNTLFRSRKRIEQYLRPYLTDDPSFGIVCKRGRLKDLMNPASIERLKKRIQKTRKAKTPEAPAALICYGSGAAIAELRPLYDSIVYFDVTRETLIRRMSENIVIPLGGPDPESIFWKGLYYVYYPMLNRHKKYVFGHMDWYVDDNGDDPPTLMPRKVYDGIVSRLVRYPLRFKRVYMPGPWGGLKFRNHFKMPELANCAWNIELSGGDSSLVVHAGNAGQIEVPFHNLYMQYPVEVVGRYCHKKYPGLFPIQVGIDDGYFPEAVPHERRAMPIHLHPDTRYVQKHFKEPLGRYEVYYIVEAYEGANTMHGFHEDADLEEFRKKCIASEREGAPFDWSGYVKCWPSKAGDLYLMPAGTAHGTGGNQMILEMDTCPSIVGTEYSFFLYDYRRQTWDDRTKSFSGKPTKLQIKHGINQCRWNRREAWVARNIRPKARVIQSGRGWSLERFDSYGPMPYHIERLNFENRMETDTRGRFFHFLCLTRGEKALIRSLNHPERQIQMDYIQTTVIPACFGKYECINLGKNPCTLTRQIWKRG
jgi:hypothetical protein